MHELSIVEALIEQVETEVDRAGARGPVARLKLSIGRLSGVNADAVRFAFQLLAPSTRLAGAALEIDEPKAVCVCAACGARTEIEELVLSCPACQAGKITIDGGREMLLETIDVDEFDR
ncbi:MAG: hydrogenase maturation nickel metallochaperone HypA [Pirellulaceae bacterium]|jgi:hydrogenase nickel incorporation protein HypA/HybF|nr:hydrogenase maturation nickel metallochaperone HypA [Thermoguttaceae bacterium]NLZ02549.1 hydrogenase maturation nickel metallochaperone HypA [Pirellulaceae bacterium]